MTCSTHPGYEVVLLELQFLCLQLRLVLQLQLCELQQIIRTVTAQPRGDLQREARDADQLGADHLQCSQWQPTPTRGLKVPPAPLLPASKLMKSEIQMRSDDLISLHFTN